MDVIRKDYSGRSIVQDNIDDCSLVAALIVGAEHHAKFGSKVSASGRRRWKLHLLKACFSYLKLAASCLYPQDPSGLPTKSPSGSHAARFLVNGVWRRVRPPLCPLLMRSVLTFCRRSVRLSVREQSSLLYRGIYCPSSSEIDDSLPTSPTGRILSASTKERDQIWPSLVEKAVGTSQLLSFYVLLMIITHST